MTGTNLEIISQIVLWYENSFSINWKYLEFISIDCWNRGSTDQHTSAPWKKLPHKV